MNTAPGKSIARRAYLTGIIGLALLWVASPGEVFAITIGIPTNTTITAVLSKKGATECVYGETVTIVAQVSPIGGTTAPSGTVQFLHNGVVIGSASLAPITNSNISLAQLVTSNLGTAGIADLTASYLGNSSPAFFSSSSPTVQETVTLANTTTSVSSGPNPSVSGQPVIFTATVTPQYSGTPTGSVYFSDGGTTLGIANLSGGTANFTISSLAAGSHVITAQYSADLNFTASISPAVTQTVAAASVQATQTILASSLNPSVTGQPVNFTATVTSSSGTPTGTVAFKDGSTIIVSGVPLSNGMATYQDATLSAGTHAITAVYSGSSNYSGSTSATLAETVNGSVAATTTTLVSSANPSVPGQAVTFRAMVTTSGPGTPSGVVTWWDGSTELGSFALSGNNASLTTSSLSLGSHSITANYGGDIAFAASTSAVLAQQVKTASGSGPSGPGTSAAGTTSTSLTSSPNPSTPGQPVTFTATITANGSGTPTGSVTFEDGSNTLGTEALNAGQANLVISSLSAGTHSITAVYSGDSSFSGSTSTVADQTVTTGGSALTNYYFAHLAFGGGWQITLTYVNYGPQSITCHTTFYSDSGKALNIPFTDGTASTRTDTLAGGADIHVQTRSDGDTASLTGWAQAQCTAPVKASLLYRLTNNGVAQGEAGVNAMSAPATEFVSFAQTATGIAYANPSTEAADITVTVLDVNGNQLGSKTLTLLPNQHSAANVGPLLGLDSFTGSVQIASTQPIAAVLLNAEAFPVFSSLPPADLPAATALAGAAATGASASATTYYFAHLAFGAGWQTTLTYVNYTPQTTTCQTTFYSDAGDPLNVPFSDGTNSLRTDSLAAGAEIHTQTQSAESEALSTGWAKAQCTGPVKASLVYRVTNGGVAQGEAAVNATSVPATEFVSFAQTATGIAFANPSSQPADVTLTVLDSKGNKLGSKTMTLQPNEHSAANVGPLVGLGTFTGSVQIVSTQPIAVVLLNAEAYPVFSSLPPADLPTQTVLAGADQ